jgi:hypothetical protein
LATSQTRRKIRHFKKSEMFSARRQGKPPSQSYRADYAFGSNPTSLHARLGVLRALNRNVERVFRSIAGNQSVISVTPRPDRSNPHSDDAPKHQRHP